MKFQQEERYEVATPHAPAAIGPYSQAVSWAGLIFISGQVGLDPATGKLVGKKVVLQTEQVLKNLSSILYCEGLDFGNVLKTTIYLAKMGDFAKVNAIYEKFVSRPYPARATVQVAKLPLNALVEIDAIACYPRA